MSHEIVSAAISVVILAAGQGTRMRSDLPKVLHRLAGRPLLAHVIDTAEDLQADEIRVVHGYGGEQVRAALAGRAVKWIEQQPQRGTGHAVQQALPGIEPGNVVLVLYGDVPLVESATLHKLLTVANDGKLAILTVEVRDPTGYGRIVRGADGGVKAIVEHRDADETQRAIHEINTGLLACRAELLAPWLDKLKPDNSQDEFYLTDIVTLAVGEGSSVAAVTARSETEVMGINDKVQLAEAERAHQHQIAHDLMTQGVGIADPARIDVRGNLVCGKDVFLDVNTVFEGSVEIGDGVTIGSNVVIRDTRIASGSKIHANSWLDGAIVGERCEVGPFARLRPDTELKDGSRIGNFVEIKKSTVGHGSKVKHLTYIGDAIIGAEVNVGAGTITCNYDGANKHRTIIGDGAFIGSGVELVAPVEIGPGATVGAGSTIGKSVPAGELALERSKQVVIRGWKRPQKKAAKNSPEGS